MSIMKETVFTKVIVRPKNSVIKRKNSAIPFYNITTGKVEIGSKWYIKDQHCSWFEPLGDNYFILKEDTMYIEFLDDISHVTDNYCSTTEMICDDIDYSDIKSDYHKVWSVIGKDFKKFLEERKGTKKILPYIMNISVNSTYCSYAGDGDVYLNITDVIKFKNGDISEKYTIRDVDKEIADQFIEMNKYFNL